MLHDVVRRCTSLCDVTALLSMKPLNGMRGSHTIRWLNGGEEGGEELPCDDHVPLNEGAVGKTKKAQKE